MDRYRIAILFLVAALAGCTDRPGTPVAATSTTAGAEVTESSADKFEQPFEKAATFDVGPDQERPVERTVAGKSAAKMRDEVERIWPTIKLIDSDQKPLPWVVTLETEAGTIEIALRPDLAPNHARNFVALVKAGYYDGLRFDRIVHQEAESPEGARSEIRLVTFGCPAGTGDRGMGHIGYRMKSEFSDEKHVAGTVGFDRDQDPSSGGTRLYITLGPAPIRDGNYTIVGQVTKGLDVVEKIAAGKLAPQAEDPARELPERPTVIRKATAEYK
jgi:peptidylprolyl isomerase